jgi:hypothetical protein
MYTYTLDQRKARKAKITYPRVIHCHAFPARYALPYPPIAALPAVDHTRDNMKTALQIMTVVNIVSFVLMIVLKG